MNQAATYTVVSSSAATALSGTTVTVTAAVSVAAPGAGTPLGTVTFVIDGVKRTPLALNAASRASLVLTGLGVGAHSVSATYNGNSNFIGSAPAPTQTVTIVGPQPTSLSATISPAMLTVQAPFTITLTALNALHLPANYSGAVAIMLMSVPLGGTILGTLSGQFKAGSAQFSNLSATLPGTYQLEIVSGNLVLPLTLTIMPAGRQS